jgi:preprotein translocase subunit SecA
MSIVNKVLGLFLGNKYERDIKEISPYVEKIHIEFEKLKDLSNDQLRDKTLEIKKRILDYINEDEDEIRALKEKAETEEDVYKKEEYYNEIDKK